MNTWILIAVLWVIPIFVASSMGKPKGREGWLYGVLLGWVGVLLLAVLPKNMARGAFVECPHCRETIRHSASVCPHCQREVAAAAVGS
jgi:uncharacterized membrane protein YeaQ/YmgE (transglycosylase-associated protein family)